MTSFADIRRTWEAETKDTETVWYAERRLQDMSKYRSVGPHMDMPVGKRYVTPFVTCRECNTLNFIDPDKLAPTLRVEGALVEQMPVCITCGTALEKKLGAWDLTEESAALRARRRAERIAQRKAAIVIQCSWKCCVARALLKRLRAERAAYLRLVNYMSTQIQRIMRGFICRRIGDVERALKRIKRCHPEIVYQAVHEKRKKEDKVDKDGKPRLPLFWYPNKLEENMVYDDYRLFVERTGYEPPLWRVEYNIFALADRVDELQGERILAIQALFRGVMGRVFVRLYREEYARIMSIRHSAAVIIQRFMRVVRAMAVGDKEGYAKGSAKLLDIYREADRDEKSIREKHVAIQDIGDFYKREIRLVRSAMFTGKVPFGIHKGKKTKVLSGSIYASQFNRVITRLMDRDERYVYRQKKYQAKAKAYNKYIDSRLKYKASLATYYEKKDPDIHEWVPKPKPTFKKVVIDRGRVAQFFRFSKPRAAERLKLQLAKTH